MRVAASIANPALVVSGLISLAGHVGAIIALNGRH
jgi:hypothetical protein